MLRSLDSLLSLRDSELFHEPAGCRNRIVLGIDILGTDPVCSRPFRVTLLYSSESKSMAATSALTPKHKSSTPSPPLWASPISRAGVRVIPYGTGSQTELSRLFSLAYWSDRYPPPRRRRASSDLPTWAAERVRVLWVRSMSMSSYTLNSIFFNMTPQ